MTIKIKAAALSCGFYFYSPNTLPLKLKPYSPPLHSSPLSAEKAVNMHAKATGGRSIGSPCKPAESSSTGQERHQG